LEEKVVERFFRLSKNEVEVAALKFSWETKGGGFSWRWGWQWGEEGGGLFPAYVTSHIADQHWMYRSVRVRSRLQEVLSLKRL
jgi:hypothetical protein